MSDVNLNIVREFFELNQFRVMTRWEHEQGRSGSGEQGLQLYVVNTAPADVERGFVLTAGDLRGVTQALVEIRAWHSDRFYPSVIENSAALRRIVEEDSLTRASDHFQSHEFVTILAISELPLSPEPRARSVELLGGIGVDHVIEFPVILQDLLDRINVNTNYPASPTLQMLRLLKGYRFIQNQQLELVFPTEPRVVAARTAHVEVEEADIDTEDDADAVGEN